jgi:hypothetical protein
MEFTRNLEVRAAPPAKKAKVEPIPSSIIVNFLNRYTDIGCCSYVICKGVGSQGL